MFKSWRVKPGFGLILALALALGLSACARDDVAHRAATSPGVDTGLTIATQGGRAARLSRAATAAGPFQIADIRVSVPRGLSVSEANGFYPIADIVWHGDVPGDRHAQVAAIMQGAAQQASGPYRGGRAVVLDIAVTKFHGVTEKTRYTIGGKHNMRFDLTLTDAVTGAVLLGPRAIVADVKAAGGDAAIAEDRAGRTQKVVVTERLVQVLRQTLGTPSAIPPEDAITVALR